MFCLILLFYYYGNAHPLFVDFNIFLFTLWGLVICLSVKSLIDVSTARKFTHRRALFDVTDGVTYVTIRR